VTSSVVEAVSVEAILDVRPNRPVAGTSAETMRLPSVEASRSEAMALACPARTAGAISLECWIADLAVAVTSVVPPQGQDAAGDEAVSVGETLPAWAEVQENI